MIIRDPFAAARNAVSNTSRREVSDAEIGAVLATGTGAGHVVRALFGDCSLESLLGLGRHLGLSADQLRAAYRTAKATHAAAHQEFESLSEP